ncbi:DUF6154 family protein [Pontibacillus yanchengensis]|uniref:Uncharacterized protein n=1 Tax=Pontibacillus yanchengensis Y32 TaxID=1385514 RepID=A0A0A2T4W9_9BACI|nr:DUF6154 family protein [Pontibacillus yanchengensis]KGP70817.1 hypothetical protein N782_04185 [Pontibacillus yanchengensis Y32]
MKFADNLYELYNKHFSEKDYLPIFTNSVIEQLDKNDLLHILSECSKEELQTVVSTFVLNDLENRDQKVISLPSSKQEKNNRSTIQYKA